MYLVNVKKFHATAKIVSYPSPSSFPYQNLLYRVIYLNYEYTYKHIGQMGAPRDNQRGQEKISAAIQMRLSLSLSLSQSGQLCLKAVLPSGPMNLLSTTH